MSLDNTSRSLFQEDWWLRAASLNQVEAVEVHWDAIRVGHLSFMRKRRGYFTQLGMPPYTRTLGPVISLPSSSAARGAMNTQRIVGELVAKLPRHDHFRQVLDPTDGNVFACSLSGCSIEQAFTFRIPPQTDLTRLLAGVSADTRRLIKSSAKRLTIDRHLNLDRFLATAKRDWRADGPTYNVEILVELFGSAQMRDQTIILSAVDQEGVDVASAVLVWGSGVLYYWLPHRNRTRSGGGANAFLLWSAAYYAMERNLIFDFDGYGSVGTASFLSSFGLPPVGRPVFTHRSLLGAFADVLLGASNLYVTANGVRPDPAIRRAFFVNARSRHRGGQPAC